MDVEARLQALEDAVARLQAEASPPHAGRQAPADVAPPAPAASQDDDRFWMLEGLRHRHPEGAVSFAGHVRLPGGEARWQWGRITEELLQEDWDPATAALAALGHPVRLRLLRLVLTGVATTSELAEAEGLGTTGQLHHHLRTLVAAGWLGQTGRGRYEVPAGRVIPLLVIISATG